MDKANETFVFDVSKKAFYFARRSQCRERTGTVPLKAWAAQAEHLPPGL